MYRGHFSGLIVLQSWNFSLNIGVRTDDPSLEFFSTPTKIFSSAQIDLATPEFPYPWGPCTILLPAPSTRCSFALLTARRSPTHSQRQLATVARPALTRGRGRLHPAACCVRAASSRSGHLPAPAQSTRRGPSHQQLAPVRLTLAASARPAAPDVTACFPSRSRWESC